MDFTHWEWQNVLLLVGTLIAALIVVLCLILWVIFPLVFMCSKPLQRFFVFLNVQQPKDPKFGNPQKYGLDGVVNFYITTTDADSAKAVRIGAWMVLPENEKNTPITITHDIGTASQLLMATSSPVLLYLHGEACNRIMPKKTYKLARQFMLVIALDHRGFGDSSSAVELSEIGIVNDTVQIYRWIRSQSSNEIFIWGHSLGAALATHTVRRLKENAIIPMGLILEAPFSTLRDELLNNKLIRPFRRLIYFNKTFLETLEKNGFHFKSTTDVTFVDCPILIMHAEDNNVIPVALGKKLYTAARKQRDFNFQGSVTYHQFPAVGYKHNDIVIDGKVSQCLEEFLEECRSENKMLG